MATISSAIGIEWWHWLVLLIVGDLQGQSVLWRRGEERQKSVKGAMPSTGGAGRAGCNRLST